MFFTKVILLKMKLFETSDSKSVTSVKIGLNTKASDREASDSYVIFINSFYGYIRSARSWNNYIYTHLIKHVCRTQNKSKNYQLILDFI
jgi:hypothetical protein